MSNQKIWGFLIHLSEHIWDDEASPPRGPYLEPDYKPANESDLETWDTVTRALPTYGINTLIIDLGDAVQYDSHPEISAPDAWSKEFLKKKLDELRAMGIRPIPKLNFSAAHDTWFKGFNRMIATPAYYAACADLIKEVCELFDYPPFFHLGMDEEIEKYQAFYTMTTVRNEALWWHDLNFLFRECEKHGARPWIWSTCSYNKFKDSFLKNMPKSVLMSCGGNGKYYGPTASPERQADTQKKIEQFLFLNDNGYDLIPLCSTWMYYRNPLQALGLAKDLLNPEQVKGFIMATWLHTKKWQCHGLIHGASALHHAREVHYPETL